MGLGLFIALIGLVDAGIIAAGESTVIGLGDATSPAFIVGMISILVTVALAARDVPGSLFVGLGFIAYALIALFKGEAARVKPLMWVAAAAFLAYFLVV